MLGLPPLPLHSITVILLKIDTSHLFLTLPVLAHREYVSCLISHFLRAARRLILAVQPFRIVHHDLLVDTHPAAYLLSKNSQDGLDGSEQHGVNGIFHSRQLFVALVVAVQHALHHSPQYAAGQQKWFNEVRFCLYKQIIDGGSEFAYIRVIHLHLHEVGKQTDQVFLLILAEVYHIQEVLLQLVAETVVGEEVECTSQVYCGAVCEGEGAEGDEAIDLPEEGSGVVVVVGDGQFLHLLIQLQHQLDGREHYANGRQLLPAVLNCREVHHVGAAGHQVGELFGHSQLMGSPGCQYSGQGFGIAHFDEVFEGVDEMLDGSKGGVMRGFEFNANVLLGEEGFDDLVGDAFVLFFAPARKGLVGGSLQEHAELQLETVSEGVEAAQTVHEGLVVEDREVANVLGLAAQSRYHPHCSPRQLYPLQPRGRGAQRLSYYYLPHHLHLLHPHSHSHPPCLPIALVDVGEAVQEAHHVVLEELVDGFPVCPQRHYFQQLQGLLAGELLHQFEHLHGLVHAQHVLLRLAVLLPQLARPLTRTLTIHRLTLQQLLDDSRAHELIPDTLLVLSKRTTADLHMKRLQFGAHLRHALHS